MKKLLWMLPVLSSIWCCTPGPANKNTPADQDELNPESASLSDLSSSKSRESDPLEILYEKQVEQTPALRQLEQQISSLTDQKNDSLQAYVSYAHTIAAYYDAANHHLNNIRDSSLKNKLKTMIGVSDTLFHELVQAHEELLKQVNEKEHRLQDLHETLKILRTLPSIKVYENKRIPSTAPIKGLINHYDRAIKQADSLSAQ